MSRARTAPRTPEDDCVPVPKAVDYSERERSPSGRSTRLTARKKQRTDADGGWKDIIEDFTEEFLEFYFPDIHKAIDFSVPVEFLDTELRQITADA